MKRNKNLLERILDDNFYPRNEEELRKAVKDDLISKVRRQQDKEFIEKYKRFAEPVLVDIYREVIDQNHKRKTFAPNTFVGFQGRLNKLILARYKIEQDLRWDLEDCVKKLSKKTFEANGLRSLLDGFKHTSDIIIALYPQLKLYYFKKAHIWIDNGKKNIDLAREATREMIYYLGWKIEDIPRKISYKTFHKRVLPYKTNLSGMLQSCFDNSPIDAIMHAHPKMNFKPYYFRNVPLKYWQGKEGLKHAREATRELIKILTDQKGRYKWRLRELSKKITYKLFLRQVMPYKSNLSGMMQVCFNNSQRAALKNTYLKLFRNL